MKKRRTYIIRGILCFLFVSLVVFSPAKVQAETKWNTQKTITYKDGDYAFYAYPSKDKKTTWIYKIELLKKNTQKPIKIPQKMNRMTVTRLGADMSTLGELDAYQSIFGQIIEPWHNEPKQGVCEPNLYSEIEKISRIDIPDTVTTIDKATFCGMKSLREIKLPESLETLGDYAFYSCMGLKK